jgi:uncharacterized membrane protein YagU involved in acid resistance
MQTAALSLKEKVLSGHQALAGIVGGLVGGILFGILMGVMGMLPMVAKLVGASSSSVGFAVHMVISGVFGYIFSLVFPSAISSGRLLIYGLIYGGLLWFGPALIIMPVWLGMSPMLSIQGIMNGLPSLMGHLIYGGVLGFLYPRLFPRV